MPSNPWLKIVLFVLGVTMLGMLASLLLDPRLGSATDESRRAKHELGFSIVMPREWRSFSTPADGETQGGSLRVGPIQSAGRETSITIGRFPKGIVHTPDEEPFTFQGQPAQVRHRKGRTMYFWRITCERDGVGYEIVVSTAVPQDVNTSPLRPFVDSFRVEAPTIVKPLFPPATTRAAG